MNTNHKLLKIQFQSIWDGDEEIVTDACLNLLTGEIKFEHFYTIQDLYILDSESIIVVHGSATSIYDVIEIDGCYFVSKEDLKTINGYQTLSDERMK